MKSRSPLFNYLLAGMAFGTAWAIRGQFGHEHGAAWAGAIGTLAILLLSGRGSWLRKGIYATMAGGLGWGLGGMMSYGLLVGYGRADDMANVCFSLAMLFVVGGLYGFVGGGLLGLSLSDRPARKVDWPSVLVQMTVGGIVVYFFVTEQFGWHANPPRSELWTACLGFAAALCWYCLREGHSAALRVAVYAGFGGGFGFAFGNFLQVLGSVSGIPFNFWNVMEYSLGFFGGIGMAYGVWTSDWGAEEDAREGREHRQAFHLWMLVLVVPFVMWEQNFDRERITDTYARLLGDDIGYAYPLVLWGSLLLIVAAAAYWLWRRRNEPSFAPDALRPFFLGHWALYMALSWIITGAVVSPYRIEQYLYLANYLVLAFAIGRVGVVSDSRPLEPARYLRMMLMVAVAIVVMAYASLQTHGEMKGGRVRFGAPKPTADSLSK